jgi:hypothetical protein
MRAPGDINNGKKKLFRIAALTIFVILLGLISGCTQSVNSDTVTFYGHIIIGGGQAPGAKVCFDTEMSSMVYEATASGNSDYTITMPYYEKTSYHYSVFYNGSKCGGSSLYPSCGDNLFDLEMV